MYTFACATTQQTNHSPKIVLSILCICLPVLQHSKLYIIYIMRLLPFTIPRRLSRLFNTHPTTTFLYFYSSHHPCKASPIHATKPQHHHNTTAPNTKTSITNISHLYTPHFLKIQPLIQLYIIRKTSTQRRGISAPPRH